MRRKCYFFFYQKCLSPCSYILVNIFQKTVHILSILADIKFNVCVCLKGYTEGSTEIQGFTSVGLSNFAYNYNVSLAHTSIIHITVIATNAAGLMREVHAEDLLVDLTPPEFLCVNDGIGIYM